MSSNIFLCIIADDFGMHPAVNEGIAKAFSEGILTDSNLMPPAPAFKEAIALTKALKMPVGLHATFTCDWDIYSWNPLSQAKSFVTAEGRLKDNVEEAWKNGNEKEALKELYEQHDAIKSEGIQMTHIGQHMDFDQGGKFERVMKLLIEKEDLPYKGVPKAQTHFPLFYDWVSGFYISGPTTVAAAKSRLKSILENLTPGYHVWVTHPAIDHESLDAICTGMFHARNWARTFRAIDLALLLDKEIAKIIHANGIELTPLAKCRLVKNEK